jgi:transposase
MEGGVEMLGGGQVKQVLELRGQGWSERAIARRLGLARNTVHKYLADPRVPVSKPRAHRTSKLDAYRPYLQQRLSDGLENAVVLLRELRARGYTGGYTILKDYLKPLRARHPAKATMRYETEPGEQAQVDFGVFRYALPSGGTRTVWGFALVLSWSRALYVEFIRRADVATFLRCHIHAFQILGGVPRRCLYDNAKVVVLDRDAAGAPIWNPRFLDFSLRLGFDPQLCRPYRPQTKGRIESGIGYVKGNFWPTARFTDDEDLNNQAAAWTDGVANQRIHGTTGERPMDRLIRERQLLRPLPPAPMLAPFFREDRKVGRDGFVQWEHSYYGVRWPWAGQLVQVAASAEVIEIWAGEQRLAVHPRSPQPGKRFAVPDQWDGLEAVDGHRHREALAVQLPMPEVERRSLGVYEALLEGVRS